MKKPSYTLKDVVLSSLVELPTANPNELPPRQREALKKSIQANGFLQPILVWKKGRKMVLCDGFHRAAVMQELGYETAPAMVIEGTEEQVRLLRISLNRVRGNLDYSIMSEELKDILENSDYEITDFDWTGLSDQELQALTADMDELDELTAQPIELMPKDDLDDRKMPRISIEFSTELEKAQVLTHLDSVYPGDRGTALLLALGLSDITEGS